MDCEKRVLTGNICCMEEARCDTIGHFLMHRLPFSAEKIMEEAAGFDTIGHFLMHQLPFSEEQIAGNLFAHCFIWSSLFPVWSFFFFFSRMFSMFALHNCSALFSFPLMLRLSVLPSFFSREYACTIRYNR